MGPVTQPLKRDKRLKRGFWRENYYGGGIIMGRELRKDAFGERVVLGLIGAM